MTLRTSPRFRLIERRALGATAGSFILLSGIAMTPLAAPPSYAETLAAYVERNAQDFDLTGAEAALAATAAAPAARDAYGYTPGSETFIRGGTNHDWAKLVLYYAGWPITDDSVTVITRWMRQENYVDSWWTRNNPLNLGAGGYASNSNLVDAAQAVGNALKKHPGYAAIVEGFATGAPSADIEYAIWYSPWSTSHYHDGQHWHYNPVEVVQAPASAWGR